MAEWPLLALSDVADLTVGHVGPMATEYVAKGVPFLRSQNVLPMRLDLEDVKYISRQFHERLSKSALRPGDVVIVRTGRPGACAVIPEGLAEANCADLVVIRCGPRIDPRYLSYYVNALAGSHIAAYTVGAVQQHFNVGAAKVMRVPLPPVGEQRRIAGILGALDDKIELNRRLAATLESLAAAIFRSWFVSFEAFPNAEFTTSEMGVIPKGWGASRLGEAADTVLGGTPSRNDPRHWGGEIPWLNSGKANEFRVIEPTEYITPAGVNESATKLVPARTTLVAITGATLGQITVTEIDACINQSLVAIMASETLPTEFVYFWLKERVGDLLAAQTGAAQQHVNKNDVNRLWVLRPPTAVMQGYVRAVGPVFDRIALACRESVALASLRDQLLPRLMRGNA